MVFLEELGDRDRRQLHAQHAMPLRGQPRHVQALAAQRHEHPAARRQPQQRPVLFEQRQHLFLVETGAAFLPAPVPEGGVHQSTARLSTFCHPRGSSPPRLARAPRYCSRSLNDSDIVRAPDFTDSVPPGGTTAMATTRSVPRLALGISMILFPLPLSNSGSSDTGNASRWPALVAATMRSVSMLATAAGCSTRAPPSLPSDSSDLPAFCRPVRFTKRVTKP